MSPPRPRRSIRRRRSAGGFTLIEVMIALTVFGVGTLALAALIPLGFKRNAASGQMSRASEIAASVSERLLHTPYGEDDLSAGTHDDPNNPYNGPYYVRWIVEENQPVSSCKRVTVELRRFSLSAPIILKTVIVTSEAGS